MKILSTSQWNDVVGGDAAATRPAGTNSYGEPSGGSASAASNSPSAGYCFANMVYYALTGSNLTYGSQCF